MRIAVAATPAIALPALEKLAGVHEIAFLLTQPDKPFGRGRELRESEVAQWGRERGIPVFKSLNECSEFESVDLVITIAYGVLIPESYLNMPRHGFINLHYSLLPRWRGAAPVQRALMAGDSRTGVTVFQLEKGMDTGPIFVQREIEIEKKWNSQDLFSQLNELGSQALLDSIALILDGGAPTPQVGEPTYAPKIEKDEYRLDFSRPASDIVNCIRGLYPSTFCLFNDRRLKILQASVAPHIYGQIGAVLETSPLIIGCGDETALVCEIVQPEGKRAMLAEEWLRGSHISKGERFE